MSKKDSNILMYKKNPNVSFNFETHIGVISHSTYNFFKKEFMNHKKFYH